MHATSTATGHPMRPQILERRAKLSAAAGAVPQAYLTQLLAEVDAALERIDNGTWGLCETCHDPIEADRLRADPLLRHCVDHLSAAELRAYQEDLELAARIQSKLLPCLERGAGDWEAHFVYRPAGLVGGDYCEVTAVDEDNSLFFAVGDVSGKGVAASLLMSHLSAILRSLVSLRLPLTEVLARANRLFCESTLSAHYATLICGRAASGTVELCNAGHCPPFLLRRGGAERLATAGVPLGLFCCAEFPVVRAEIGAGESLVLYSDGVTESRDADGRDFSEEGLLASAAMRSGRSAKELAEGIVEDAARFRGGAPASDDVTVLVLRR